MRKDGVVFWNLGDSYASQAGGYDTTDSRGVSAQISEKTQSAVLCGKQRKPPPGLKPKDLCLIPFRFAIAAQEAGWWVRSVVIWNKQNPMPESCKDRPTDSHEYIFLLTKNAKYYWDQEAVRERSTGQNGQAANFARQTKDEIFPGQLVPQHRLDRVPTEDNGGRNLRSVWSFPTTPFKGAHFATFPEALPERCIKAGTPEFGCCDKCGRPYERNLEISRTYQSGSGKAGNKPLGKWNDAQSAGNLEDDIRSGPCISTKTIGWKQACKCPDSKPVPSLVLDPFAGSGTTLEVATKLGRRSVGYEISSEYCDLIIKRNAQTAL